MKETAPVTNLNVLAMLVTQREGGKVNLPIGQVKEVIKVVSQLMVERPEIIAMLINNGHKKRVKK